MVRDFAVEVRKRANDRCEYCRLPQAGHRLTFPIDHIIARQHEGEQDPSNLALSCTMCNSYKGPNIASIDPATGPLTPLFHPRRDSWDDHFQLAGSRIEGLTPTGRVTVRLLQMNRDDYLLLRQALIKEGMF